MPRCCMCGSDKPATDFAFRSIATGVRQGRCRVCHAAYGREHYLRNREIYITREVARIKTFRDTNRAQVLAYLKTHPCVDCGEADPVLLEFDHRDRALKSAAVMLIAVHKPWKFVGVEIDKCDVRCIACHRRRTATQFNWRKLRRPDVPTDRSPSAAASIPAPSTVVVTGQPRECTKCNATKPLGEFVIKDQRTGQRGSRCRPCIAAASREHYWKNRDAYLQRVRSKRANWEDPKRDLLLEYLSTHPCVDCGETEPLLLEFDHRDRATKVDAVSRLVWQRRWDDVLTEIAKCDVRCVRCHRRKTANEFGWSRLGEDRRIYEYAGVL